MLHRSVQSPETQLQAKYMDMYLLLTIGQAMFAKCKMIVLLFHIVVNLLVVGTNSQMNEEIISQNNIKL